MMFHMRKRRAVQVAPAEVNVCLCCMCLCCMCVLVLNWRESPLQLQLPDGSAWLSTVKEGSSVLPAQLSSTGTGKESLEPAHHVCLAPCKRCALQMLFCLIVLLDSFA